MRINLDGAFFMARECLPAMKSKGWGRIVNICSLAAKTGGLTAGTAYTTSKGGMTALTFSLARESASDGVTVNGISPAYIRTPMVTEQLTEAQRQKLLADIPVHRFCEAEEVAHVVQFLVSPSLQIQTGSTPSQFSSTPLPQTSTAPGFIETLLSLQSNGALQSGSEDKP